jgi:glucokinase
MDTKEHKCRGGTPSSFPSVHHALGLDLGGTKIAAGLAAFPEGRVLARRTIPTHAARGGRAVLDDALRLARELAAEAAAAGASVSALGLGVCELVNREGRLASTNCLPWPGLPVLEELAAVAPAVFEADVRAAALAEARFGAGRGFRQFVYLTVGTGLSACLMLGGRPHLGARGLTGTFASSPLSLPCEACGHVSGRTLEEVAAGPALAARFRAAGGHAASGQDVLAAAAAGDAAARQVVESAAEALASQAGLLIGMLDPEALVVGGGLGLSDGPYWEHFVAATRRHVWSPRHRDLPILRAATGADAGWLGAALHACESLSPPSPLTPTHSRS